MHNPMYTKTYTKEEIQEIIAHEAELQGCVKVKGKIKKLRLSKELKLVLCSYLAFHIPELHKTAKYWALPEGTMYNWLHMYIGEYPLPEEVPALLQKYMDNPVEKVKIVKSKPLQEEEYKPTGLVQVFFESEASKLTSALEQLDTEWNRLNDLREALATCEKAGYTVYRPATT